MPGPISPDEVVAKKIMQIPEIVFEVTNELIAEKWTGRSARFTLDELAKRVVDRGCFSSMKDAEAYRAGLFEKRAFDIEDSYRALGWTVLFDSPAYNESYPATFTFTHKALKEQ